MTELSRHVRLADHDSEPEAAAGPRRADHPARGVQARERSAAGRRAGHRRADHAAGPHQRGFRGRPHRDGRDRACHDGLRHRHAASTARASQPRWRCRRRCSRTSTSRARTASWSTSRRASTSRSASSRKSAAPSSSSRPKTRPSWSAPSSSRRCRANCALPWSRPASTARRRRQRHRSRSAPAAAAQRRAADVKLVAQRNRAPAPDYSHLDQPAIRRQPQRAVGDGLRTGYGCRGRAGHPGVPPAPGGLRRRVPRARRTRGTPSRAAAPAGAAPRVGPSRRAVARARAFGYAYMSSGTWPPACLRWPAAGDPRAVISCIEASHGAATHAERADPGDRHRPAHRTQGTHDAAPGAARYRHRVPPHATSSRPSTFRARATEVGRDDAGHDARGGRGAACPRSST